MLGRERTKDVARSRLSSVLREDRTTVTARDLALMQLDVLAALTVPGDGARRGEHHRRPRPADREDPTGVQRARALGQAPALSGSRGRENGAVIKNLQSVQKRLQFFPLCCIIQYKNQ